MMKAIFAGGVQKGDTIQRGGMVLSVERVIVVGVNRFGMGRPGSLEFICGETRVTFFPGDIVGLLHQPWPEGKTEQDMLDTVGEIARALGLNISDATEYRTGRWGGELAGEYEKRTKEQIHTNLRRLREALDAYELGKPLEETKD